MSGPPVLDDGNPDEALLRRWAYDTDLLLTDQDEDLLLATNDGHVRTLLHLVQDADCPKGDYIAEILQLWAREKALAAVGPSPGEQTADARASLFGYVDSFIPESPAAERFSGYALRLIGWLSARPRTGEDAHQIIRDLVRDRYDGSDEDRWQVAVRDGVVVGAVPYGSPTLGISQRITVDLSSGEVHSVLDFPAGQHGAG